MKPSSVKTGAHLDFSWFGWWQQPLPVLFAQIKGHFMRLHTGMFTRWPCACLRVRKKVNCILACRLRFWANLLSYPLLHFQWEAPLIAFCSVCTCHRKIDYSCSIDPTHPLPPHRPPASSSYDRFIILQYYSNIF